jgi:NDP-sugar pyrophosphorylase family protein
MIFAAGLGTRLQPWTNTKPKALVEFNKIPLLEIIIKKLINYNFNEIVINVHHFAEQIEDFLKKKNYYGIDIFLSDERELLLDTGGGLKKAQNFLKGTEPFLLYNVDIFSDINLIEFYNYHIKNSALVTLAVKERETSRSLVFSNDNYLCHWQNNVTGEKKISRQLSNNLKKYAFSGIHIVNTEVFELIEEEGVFSIIDLYLRLATTFKISAYNENSFWLDMGKKENFSFKF